MANYTLHQLNWADLDASEIAHTTLGLRDPHAVQADFAAGKYAAIMLWQDDRPVKLVLEAIFVATNTLDDARPWTREIIRDSHMRSISRPDGCRSTSVGDVVTDAEEHMWVCGVLGWQLVN